MHTIFNATDYYEEYVEEAKEEVSSLGKRWQDKEKHKLEAMQTPETKMALIKGIEAVKIFHYIMRGGTTGAHEKYYTPVKHLEQSYEEPVMLDQDHTLALMTLPQVLSVVIGTMGEPNGRLVVSEDDIVDMEAYVGELEVMLNVVNEGGT